jgi:hypothetical protein
MSFDFNNLKITNSEKKEKIISILNIFPNNLVNDEINSINNKIQLKINANYTDSELNNFIDKIIEYLYIKKNSLTIESFEDSSNDSSKYSSEESKPLEKLYVIDEPTNIIEPDTNIEPIVVKKKTICKYIYNYFFCLK